LNQSINQRIHPPKCNKKTKTKTTPNRGRQKES
jgi:hypothetical protein